MPISFIFTNKVVSEAFSKKTTPFAILSSQIIDKTFDIFQQFDGFNLYITHQTFDHIKAAFSSEQLARFENAFNKENTTQGVNGYSVK